MSHLFKQSPCLQHEEIGLSSEGRPIELLKLSSGPRKLLLIGGVHGDEPEGFYLVEEFIKQQLAQELEGIAELWALPRMNPDGCANKTRTNARGVDLNRNMPTKDWNPTALKERYQPGASAGSEVETQILMQLIERLKPHAIITAHSWEPMINYNGPAKNLAQAMSAVNGYRIDDDIGYPTPGSLGTWAGWERQIPTITLEIERDSSEEKIWKEHRDSLLAGLKFAAQNEKLG